MTLGGYDVSRFGSKNLTIPFYSDVSRRYLVQLSSIKYIPTGLSTSTTASVLSSDSISIYIDSTIPYIYLPDTVCSKFESAFGLSWNESSQIYTINDTAHSSLESMNPNVTFTLSNNGKLLDIILPYKAFDLTASVPVIPNGTVNYFPLKRTANDTQYTLGRTFLQEAYMMADFDRSEFTIAPCVWPSTFTPDIRSLVPSTSAANSTNNTTSSVGSESIKSSTPKGAIVGGVIGGLALLVGCLALFYFFIYRPKRKATKTHEAPTDATSGQSTAPPSARNEERHTDKKKQPEAEIAGGPILGSELPSPDAIGNEIDSMQVFEMPAGPAASELGFGSGHEMSERPFSWAKNEKSRHTVK